MSSRLTYANGAVALLEWIRECEQTAPEGVEGDGAALEFLAAWLADGGSMKGLCERYGLMWGVLAAWVRSDPVREQRYQQALMDRSAFRREKLLDGWWETAEMRPEEMVGHGDVHKAREALAKAEGVFSDASRVVVDNHVTIVHESA